MSAKKVIIRILTFVLSVFVFSQTAFASSPYHADMITTYLNYLADFHTSNATVTTLFDKRITRVQYNNGIILDVNLDAKGYVNGYTVAIPTSKISAQGNHAYLQGKLFGSLAFFITDNYNANWWEEGNLTYIFTFPGYDYTTQIGDIMYSEYCKKNFANTGETYFCWEIKDMQFTDLPVTADTAQMILDQMIKTHSLNISQSFLYNETTDPNQNLGMDGEYQAKINFIDKTISGDITVKDAKVAQGGSIEVFEAVNDAIVRHNYLQETFFLYDLGNETTFRYKNALLRLSDLHTPESVATYIEAFIQAVDLIFN